MKVRKEIQWKKEVVSSSTKVVDKVCCDDMKRVLDGLGTVGTLPNYKLCPYCGEMIEHVGDAEVEV